MSAISPAPAPISSARRKPAAARPRCCSAPPTTRTSSTRSARMASRPTPRRRAPGTSAPSSSGSRAPRPSSRRSRTTGPISNVPEPGDRSGAPLRRRCRGRAGRRSRRFGRARAAPKQTRPRRVASVPRADGRRVAAAMTSGSRSRATPMCGPRRHPLRTRCRVAEKGAKLRVTGRKGNWVQVTDPATAEVGWIYSRFIETAQAPAR